MATSCINCSLKFAQDIRLCWSKHVNKDAFSRLPEQLKRLFTMKCVDAICGCKQESSFFNGSLHAVWIKHCSLEIPHIEIVEYCFDAHQLERFFAAMAFNKNVTGLTLCRVH